MALIGVLTYAASTSRAKFQRAPVLVAGNDGVAPSFFRRRCSKSQVGTTSACQQMCPGSR